MEVTSVACNYQYKLNSIDIKALSSSSCLHCSARINNSTNLTLRQILGYKHHLKKHIFKINMGFVSVISNLKQVVINK